MITVKEVCCYILQANRKTSTDHTVLCKHLEAYRIVSTNFSERKRQKECVLKLILKKNMINSLCPPHEEDICLTLPALYTSVKAGVIEFLAPTEMTRIGATEV